MRTALIAGSLMIATEGCRTVPERREQRAVIIHPGGQSWAALSDAVSKALNGARVRLADDALINTDLLIVEREQLRDPSGLPINGREREMPEQFRLVKAGDQCILVHTRTGRRFPLSGVDCSPL